MYVYSSTPIRRPFSLSGADHYPLICVKPSPLPPAARTAHSVAIDEWIDISKSLRYAPVRDENTPYQSLDFLLWRDRVECILNVNCKKGLVEGPFKDPDEFTLTLHLRVPPTSGFLMYFWQSPTIVIDKYIGDREHSSAPKWISTVHSERKFWQRRCVMIEMMLHIVGDFTDNRRILPRVQDWCEAMSMPASGRTASIRPRKFVYQAYPRNTRRHKPRASDLSAEEAQELRMSLNLDESPLKRRK